MSQASKYENKNPLHQYALDRFLTHIKNAVDESAATSILEVGSADGYVMKYLIDRNSILELYGVDVDRDALERARAMNPGLSFEYGNVETNIVSRGQFDVVMALELLEHVENIGNALSNIQKLNAKYFLLSVPHEPFFRMLNFLRGRHWKRLGNHPEHLHTWGKNEFKQVISRYFSVKKDYSSFPWTIYLATKKDD